MLPGLFHQSAGLVKELVWADHGCPNNADLLYLFSEPAYL